MADGGRPQQESLTYLSKTPESKRMRIIKSRPDEGTIETADLFLCAMQIPNQLAFHQVAYRNLNSSTQLC